MSQLEDLLQQCTVKLTIPGQMGWGTGFFVATGWILTCGHVVKQAGGQPVQVRWQQQENWAQAVVERVLPEPYDVALLRVTLPMGVNPPCVYLDEGVDSRDPLYLFGYPDEGDRQGEPRTFNCDGRTGGEIPAILFKLGQVRPGMSGSSLLNQRTGKVCGMVKFTRDRSFDLGGGAIPTGVILEQLPELRELQREFHGSDRRWVNLITTQSGIDFQPYLQAILADDSYREWQEVYTPTTVEDRRRMPEQEAEIASQRRFSSRLKLRAETVKPDKREQGDRLDGVPESQERVEQWDVLAGLRNYAAEHVVLIGKPGSGKSTSLERLLWEEAEKALQNPNAQIPVLVKLRRCTGTIEGLIRDFLVGHQIALEIAQIEELLCQGRFLLLLDGLNELPELFKTEVANFRDRYRRTTPMIVSTRDLGGGGTLGIEKTLKMLPLTEPEICEFVRGYLGEEGDRLFQQLHGDRLRKFAETPLLLWMLCRVFVHNGKVPDNLGLAFREFTQLHDQELQADAPSDSKDQWHKLLRHLAFVMMQGKTLIDPQLSILKEEAEDCLTAYLQQAGRSNPREYAEHWLKDLLKYHLIQPVIQPNFEEHIEFRHQLIQEYYAAEYLLRILPDLSDTQLKRDYLNYLKWTEPVALMLALLNNEEQAVRVMKLALGIDHWLGARLSGEVKPEFQMQTIKFVKDLEVPDWLKVQLLGETRSENVIACLLTLVKHAEADIRWRAVEALGKIGSEKVIPELLPLVKHTNADMRWRTVEVLGRIASEKVIPELLTLVEHANDSVVRWKATEALGQIGSSKAVSGLIKLIEHSDYNIRREVAEALGQIGSDEAIPGLLKLAEDDNSSVRVRVAEALGRIGSDEAIPGSLKLAEDANSSVRVRVEEVQGEIGSGELVLELFELIENTDSSVRRKAVDTLSQISSAQTIPGLFKLVDDNDLGVRVRVAEALGRIGSDEAIPGLFKLLEDDNLGVRRRVAEALGNIGSIQTIPGLLKLLEDNDSGVRRRAAEALVQIGSVAALPGLLKLLNDTDFNMRRKAATALVQIDSTDTIPGLLQLVKDAGSYAPGSVAKALDNIAKKHPEATAHYLSHFFTLIPSNAGQESLRAIHRIQANCKFYNYEIYQAHQAAQKVDRQIQQNREPGTTINAEIVQIIENNQGTIIGKST